MKVFLVKQIVKKFDKGSSNGYTSKLKEGINMLGFKEKGKIQKWLKDPTLAKNLSFILQKEEITKKYPEAFLVEEN